MSELTNSDKNKAETIVTINDYSKLSSLSENNENKSGNADTRKMNATVSPSKPRNFSLIKKLNEKIIPKKPKLKLELDDSEQIRKERKIKLENKLSANAIRRFEQLVDVLKKETTSIIKGNFQALGDIAQQKSELINEYLRLRKELRIKCGDEPNWLKLLNSEQMASLRVTSNEFEFEMNRNQIALRRASNSVQEVMDVYYQAVRETNSYEGVYTSSGKVIPSSLPSLSFEKDF